MTVAALTLATLWSIVVTASRHPEAWSMIWFTHLAIQLGYLQPVARAAANENGRRVA